ncbi:MAG TPA: PLP-dependent aminotransferase family protein [Candidatus Acidoferrales bacterium]|nr:PLP-dependent aminotransferase family protein [Candidatus Acidoferrales bacterium]HTX57992.1 PLP-dependent aminotransferase family protein [Candidatus Acidoferrales bacterium]
MRTEGIVLDRGSSTPLHRQLETALREAILCGSLKAGERILASRELQTHLGLSRNTILTALAQLQAEGYLVTVPSTGTFVADVLRGRSIAVKAEPTAGELVPTRTAHLLIENAGLATNWELIAPFRPGIPALDLFPATLLKRSFAVDDWNAHVLDYPDPFGDVQLREAIAKRLHQTRGIACSIEDVAVIGGAQAAFALLSTVLLTRGDAVIVEDPSYPNVLAAFACAGARLIHASVDEAGIDVRSFARKRATLAYVTPSHQYPTGAVLSLARRFALLRWAQEQAAWIVEDDYDSEFNYSGRVQPALRSLDGGDRVLYLGTFSKVLAPGLRVSYMIVPHELRRAIAAALAVTGAQPSAIVQRALARFMTNGHLGRHIVKMRKIYDERRRYVSAEIQRVMHVPVVDSQAGLHFVAELPRSIVDTGISDRAMAKRLVVPALSRYVHTVPKRNGLLIGYAAFSPAVAKAAIATLATLV